MGRRHRSRRPQHESDQGYQYAPPGHYDHPDPQHGDYPPRRQRQPGDYLPQVPGDYHPQSDDFLPPRSEDYLPPPSEGSRRSSWTEDYRPGQPGSYLLPPPSDEQQRFPDDYPPPGRYKYSERQSEEYPAIDSYNNSTQGHDYSSPQGYEYAYQAPEDVAYPPPPPPIDNFPLSADDYHKVKQRNFDVWLQWRTSMNDSILAEVNDQQPLPVPPIEVALQTAVDPMNRPTRSALLHDPNVLMDYSLSVNNVTDLANDSFFKFGIPRASMNPNNTVYGKLFSPDGEDELAGEGNKKEEVYTVRMITVRDEDDPTLPRKRTGDVLQRWAK